MSATRKRRPSFTDNELKIFYVAVGAMIGTEQASGILHDLAVSQTAALTRPLIELQAKILDALENTNKE